MTLQHGVKECQNLFRRIETKNVNFLFLAAAFVLPLELVTWEFNYELTLFSFKKEEETIGY